MADMCTYFSSDGKQFVNLDGDGTWVGTAPAMRGRAWSYSLGARRISAVQRKATALRWLAGMQVRRAPRVAIRQSAYCIRGGITKSRRSNPAVEPII